MGRRAGGGGGATAQCLACLTPLLVCVGTAFHPHIVAAVHLIHAVLSETDNNEE
jgi:hypothetical protein